MIRVFNKMDKFLLFSTIVMFIFGLFMIFDASSMRSFIESNNNYEYFSKQLIILIVCFVTFIGIAITDFKKYTNLVINFIALALGACLLFLLLKGSAINNSRSWIKIWKFSFQPSEFVKTFTIMYMAIFYYINAKRMNIKWIAFIPPIISGIFCLLTLAQPDGGTGLIIGIITLVLFFISPISINYKKIGAMALLGIIVVGLFVVVVFKADFLSDMQKSRFNFTKPCTRYQESTGYQVCNGYIAINNGKIFSLEPGNSKQKYLYLPEAHTDFIFPIIVEEMGLVVGVFAILVYAFILFRIIFIAEHSYNSRNKMICYGTALYLFLHIIINLMGVFGLMPLTGVPLPFLSYGGSFALSITIALSLVQRVAIDNYEFGKKRVLKNKKI